MVVAPDSSAESHDTVVWEMTRGEMRKSLLLRTEMREEGMICMTPFHSGIFSCFVGSVSKFAFRMASCDRNIAVSRKNVCLDQEGIRSLFASASSQS